MLKQEVISGSSSGGYNNWPRICDKCHSAPSTVYCQADSSHLCTDCNARIHATKQTSSTHDRVWLCEACERMPAKFLCKADAASLCANCDAEIHSANPLAHRHQRVPIYPVSGSIYGPTTASTEGGGGRLLEQTGDGMDSFLAAEGDGETSFNKEDEDEAASWLLFNSVKNMNVLGGDVDEYLDLDEYNSDTDTQFSHEIKYNQQQESTSIFLQTCYGRCDVDRVMPVVQCAETKFRLRNQQQLQNIRMGMDYETNAAYGYNASISGSDSVSSLDACTLHESSTMIDMTMAHSRPSKGDHHFPNPPTQLSPMDREARVLRYREKKKTRKFEKKIRYASRKAYAETRPRIKGRFAKRSDLEVAEMERKFSNSNNLLKGESAYGILPCHKHWKCNEDTVVACK